MNLARKPKTLWNMRMTMMPNVISTFGTVSKSLEKETEGLEDQRKN